MRRHFMWHNTATRPMASGPKSMVAKFAGTCRTCKLPFPAGAPIVWSREAGATHAKLADCAAATAAAVPTAPVPPTTVAAGTVVAFLSAAKDRGLKAPKVRFLAPANGELRLAMAGGNTKYPGAVQVKVNGVWVGRIEADGTLTPRMASDPAMVATLTSIATDPATAAAAFGALMGRCSFCNLTLTDAGSVEVGYGPICAKHYGLPHTPKGTPDVLAVAA